MRRDAMDLDKSDNMYMILMYVYLKSYEEAIDDFQEAVKNIGFSDLALMAVEQKFKERIEKVAREISSNDLAR